MAIVKDINPKRVFHYFEEICNIPHASYNTKPIADYLEDFANEYALKYHRDQYDNIVIFKAATPGYESSETVILQGHSDMVAEKVSTSSHDFATDGLKLLVDGDYLKAEGTTLGGDDGIAVAFALAILEDDTISHPALEILITANEEVGLLGAMQFDTSILKGSRLINLDSEEEGVLLIGCAGGMTTHCTLSVLSHAQENTQFEIIISGLKGGHSGVEINKNRANANVLMGRLLHDLDAQVDFAIAKLNGGEKSNVITSSACAVILADNADAQTLTAITNKLQKDLRKEYANIDDDITIEVNDLGRGTLDVIDSVAQRKLIFFLMNVPFGVQKMSGKIPELVETSANVGAVSLTAQGIKIECSIRSTVSSAKIAIAEKIKYLTEFLGGEYYVNGEYPAWEIQATSTLRDVMVKEYREMFNQETKVTAIHAGLECGIFYDKMPHLDCVSIGPDVFDVHSPNERMSLSSVERTWQYLLKVLESLR